VSLVRLRPVWMTNHRPSVLWHCWLGHQTCKNCRPYNLYCVGSDVKPCSIKHRRQIQVLGIGKMCLVRCMLSISIKNRNRLRFSCISVFGLEFCYSWCLFSVRYRCIWGRCGVSWHPVHGRWKSYGIRHLHRYNDASRHQRCRNDVVDVVVVTRLVMLNDIR